MAKNFEVGHDGFFLLGEKELYSCGEAEKTWYPVIRRH
jgi:hypothetical protein